MGAKVNNSGRRWVGAVVALLAGHVLLMVAVAVIAVRSGAGKGIIPDHYRRGLKWDEQKAAMEAGRRLGWTADVEAAGRADASGYRPVTFVLTGPDGRGIEGATLEVAYFHHADGGQVQRLSIDAALGKGGRYEVSVPMRRAGLWEFEVTARTAGGQRCVFKVLRDVTNDNDNRGTGYQPVRATSHHGGREGREGGVRPEASSVLSVVESTLHGLVARATAAEEGGSA